MFYFCPGTVVYPTSLSGYPAVGRILTPPVPPFRCCLSPCSLDLIWLPRFSVFQFDQRPYANLPGPTLRPLLPLPFSVLVLSPLPFGHWPNVRSLGPKLQAPIRFPLCSVTYFPPSLLTVLLRLCLSLVCLRFLVLSCLALSIFVARSLLVDRKYIPDLGLLRL